jgi:hypothetical protein
MTSRVLGLVLVSLSFIAGCGGDPCYGVVCDQIPASRCIDDSTLESYSGGVCNASGDCSYAPNDITCANGCTDGGCIVAAGNDVSPYETCADSTDVVVGHCV